MRKIKVIPATINPLTKAPNATFTKRKVCGYARVSTDSDEQFTSYQAQIDYYTDYIKKNQDWEFAGVYTDEGVTGTSTKNRDGFNNMIADALDGKVDLIVTKSISRFARNTVDTLVTIRKLKEHGVECFFEKENIYTFDSKGELLITIMSSLAQEESRSISENVTWGHRKAFSDGRFHVGYSIFLGYKKGENKPLEIVEEEARTVRMIYRLFLEGLTFSGICRELEKEAILSPTKKNRWYPTTVKSILTNEKYKGDALLQKTYTVDFLTGKSVINNGEVQQYYVQNSHDAIIDPIEWEMVQIELKRRSNIGTSYSGTSPFTGKLTCSSCGGLYGPKVWNSTDKYRKTVWQCNNKFKRGNKTRCQTPTLTEDNIKDAFIDSYNVYLANKIRILEDLNEGLRIAFNTDSLDKKIAEVTLELEGVSLLVQRLIDENSTTTMSQVEYKDRYESLEQTYNKKRIILEELQQQKSHIFEREVQMKMYIRNLENASTVITVWDQKLWNLFVDRAMVSQNGEIKIKFKMHNFNSEELFMIL